jgi:putative spermidine/putrescine transport system ATP-binding protein/spermidine/putrescine transport system ATP-binding protein
MSVLILNRIKVTHENLQVTLEDVQVEAGEWLLLSAPSGFGKSTVLRGILGLNPLEGEILLDGKRLDQLPVHERNLGVVFQDALLFPHLNAFQNSWFGVKMRRKPTERDYERAQEGFQVLGLSQRMEAPLQELSGGERQRIALIRALLFDPDVLIFDEPFKGVDRAMIEKMKGYIDTYLLKRPVPVIWVTHQNEFEPARQKRLLGGELHHGCRHFKYDSGKS